MSKQLLFSILIISSLGCSGQDTRNESSLSSDMGLGSIIYDYRSIKSFFPSKYIEFFPNELDTSFITYSDCLSPELGALHLYLVKHITWKDSSIIDSVYSNYEALYLSSDTCLLVINRFANRDRYFNIIISKEEEQQIKLPCYEDKLPIPNFWQFDFSTKANESKLPNGYQIYVLEAKSGNYMSDKLLTNGKSMPMMWKNGISKGIAINSIEGIIIYWLSIW